MKLFCPWISSSDGEKEYIFEQTRMGKRIARDETWARKLRFKACEKAGIQHFGLHTYRHYRASKWLAEGINPAIIQEWLGHESFATTAIYLRSIGRVEYLRGVPHGIP